MVTGNFTNQTRPENSSAGPPVTPSSLAATSWFGVSMSASVGSSSMLIILLLTSLRHQKMRKGTGTLIIHLMLMQLTLCLIYFPIEDITTYLALRSIPVRIDCEALLILRLGTMYSENWASLLLALNRFIALELPHFYQRILTRNALIAMIIFPWIVGLGSTLWVHFGTVGVDLIQLPLPYGYCASRVTKGVNGTILVAIGAYGPLLFMGLIYSNLCYRLMVTRSQGTHRSSVGPIIHNKESSRLVGARARQKALAKMLIVSFLWYCVFFLPGPLVVTTFPALTKRFVICYPWLRTMNLFGYAASPFIFLLLNAEYQATVGRLFGFRSSTDFSPSIAPDTFRPNTPRARLSMRPAISIAA
ncbi:hypothetical protein BV898_01057 [Hypsibius exemplaris]|uniref:G-protein coupled receptors family 1 profile domain-containing protein n=1 Tax=Hypsibius exemplaris TaxID=2072580 RepID=A0A1W0XD28_HYPEX|nr:hypothetical protein BV898_01057 [Hypsibius exemplaris]